MFSNFLFQSEDRTEDSNPSMSFEVIMKVQKLRSFTDPSNKRTTSTFGSEIQSIIVNDSNKQIRSLASEMGEYEFLIKQVLLEDICSFSRKKRQGSKGLKRR